MGVTRTWSDSFPSERDLRHLVLLIDSARRLTPPGDWLVREAVKTMSGPIVRWLHRHDPEWNALHKAIKVAIAVTVGLAFGTFVVGNSQFSTFASFGGVALLLFAEFPGGRSARLGAFVGLALIGALLIVLGTLASVVAWLAVIGMGVVGFIVLFAGLFSAAAAGATRAALLAFILPVSLPVAETSGSAGWVGHRGDAGGSTWRSWCGHRVITTGCGCGPRRPVRPCPTSCWPVRERFPIRVRTVTRTSGRVRCS